MRNDPIKKKPRLTQKTIEILFSRGGGTCTPHALGKKPEGRLEPLLFSALADEDDARSGSQAFSAAALTEASLLFSGT